MSILSRRRFGAQACALACMCATPVSAAARAGRFPALAARPALTQPEYGRVQLTPGRMDDQLRHQHALFLGIDNDRLLKPFRIRAGQPAPGEDMGGWYDASDDFHIDPNDWNTANWHGYIPGHSFGQYLSGLARLYAITGDAGTKRKVESLVEAYIPTVSPRFYDDYNLPAYTYDKLVIGLIDAYNYAGVIRAADALEKTTGAALPYLPEMALTREERRARPYTREAQIWDEPYTLPEHLFQAWKLGLGESYKVLAQRYLQDEALFDPLAQGVSPLKGKHAYSHVNALNSAIEAWYATGEEKYLKAAVNGFDFVQKQSYATGGWGPNEELLAADDTQTLFDMLTATHRTFETPCGAYGHFKITRSLLQITRDSRYGDSMERVLYNTILGAKPTTPDGDAFYYSDYHETATKVFRGEKWPCCSGTFIQLTADYGISAYLTDADGPYINLYIPSVASLPIKGQTVKLEQTTGYPLTDTTRIRVTPERAAKFSVRLRIPQWAGPTTEVRINGKPLAGRIEAGRFLDIARLWQTGDVIDLRLDMGLRLDPLNAAHPDVAALMTGPLALFVIDPTDAVVTRKAWLSATQESAEIWRVETPSGPLRLKPFMSIGDETYRLYHRITG